MKWLIDKIEQIKEKPWLILKVKLKGNDLCKTCKKNIRRDGSSYCKECSDKYKNNESI